MIYPVDSVIHPLDNLGQACDSQKFRELLGPERFSGLFTGAFLGFEKAFLERFESVPYFSRRFSGFVTQELARALIFQTVIGSKIATDTSALSWVCYVRIKFKTFSMDCLQSCISTVLAMYFLLLIHLWATECKGNLM